MFANNAFNEFSENMVASEKCIPNNLILDISNVPHLNAIKIKMFLSFPFLCPAAFQINAN